MATQQNRDELQKFARHYILGMKAKFHENKLELPWEVKKVREQNSGLDEQNRLEQEREAWEKWFDNAENIITAFLTAQQVARNNGGRLNREFIGDSNGDSNIGLKVMVHKIDMLEKPGTTAETNPAGRLVDTEYRLEAGEVFLPVPAASLSENTQHELLARLVLDEQGDQKLSQPGEWLPVLEAAGLMPKHDLMMLQVALDTLAANPQEQGQPTHLLEVNLSAQLLGDRVARESLLAKVRGYSPEILRGRLRVELDNLPALLNPKSPSDQTATNPEPKLTFSDLVDFIQKLKAAGVDVALDNITPQKAREWVEAFDSKASKKQLKWVETDSPPTEIGRAFGLITGALGIDTVKLVPGIHPSILKWAVEHIRDGTLNNIPFQDKTQEDNRVASLRAIESFSEFYAGFHGAKTTLEAKSGQLPSVICERTPPELIEPILNGLGHALAPAGVQYLPGDDPRRMDRKFGPFGLLKKYFPRRLVDISDRASEDRASETVSLHPQAGGLTR